MKKFILLTFLLLAFKAASYSQDGPMEAVGFLGGQNLYYLYTSIGLLADSYYNGVYGSDFATRMAKNISDSAVKSKAIFNKLLDSNTMSKADIDRIKDIQDAYDRLVNESDAFISSVEVYNSETSSRFKSYKDKAWERIKDIWIPSD